jgi:hypothetical protein
LGRIRFTPLRPWVFPEFTGQASGFVSLSYFCPAKGDPTNGYWKLVAKHPVPAQFVSGERVILGSGKDWRVRSLLRLTPGSCFWFGDGQKLEEYYGRMLTASELLAPKRNDDPPLFHYALAFPVPICVPR